MKYSLKIFLTVLLIGGGFLYAVSPFIVTNQIMNSIVSNNVSKFTFFVDNERLKENTKDVMMRELTKKIPEKTVQDKSAKYLAEKTIEAGLNKYLNPAFLVNMFSKTMFTTSDKLVINYDYDMLSPNTFIWNVKYEDSKKDFSVTLKRSLLIIWKIEKIDFKIE